MCPWSVSEVRVLREVWHTATGLVVWQLRCTWAVCGTNYHGTQNHQARIHARVPLLAPPAKLSDSASRAKSTAEISNLESVM
jgi:hypothetical protein